MRLRILLSSLLLTFLVGCKSYEYKVKDKPKLAELCVYEFPMEIKVPKPEIKVNISHVTKKVIDSVDCTDKTGFVPIEIEIEVEEKHTEEIKYLSDPMIGAKLAYIAELERKNEGLTEDLFKSKKSEKQAKKRIAWLLLTTTIVSMLLIRKLFVK